ncbi:MAG: aminotransferase class I/II-fold pyridoxal phosphate-dependent enzyme [Spirochaetota bacterium]
MKIFEKSFTQQEPIPEAGIQAACEVMRSGRLHRYNLVEGECGEANLLEKEFSNYLGLPYVLACASCGYALHIALKAAGIQSGDIVLTNAFTLAPVPGAIHNSGGVPELIELTEDYLIDLEHLEQSVQRTKARFFLLSHMRGHIVNMEQVESLCQKYNLYLIEDCAHTMGAQWNGRKSGTFGQISCFSTQTYKHINSGEGGLLATKDPEVMAKLILYSGSYMLFETHTLAPDPEVFAAIRYNIPNYSGRMDQLRAAILRPQLAALDEQVARWNALYCCVAEGLQKSSKIIFPNRPPEEKFVGSSIQFSLPDFSEQQIRQVLVRCKERGVVLKWFGDSVPRGFTSRYDSWHYLDSLPELLRTKKVLAKLLDMRIPLTFLREDCLLLSEIIVDVVENL